MVCIYPVLQKYYSALKNITELNPNNLFFDNIAYVDNFFSEFRNITFVLQKLLKTDEEKQIYQELNSKHFSNDLMKWFVSTRNEVLKEHPFILKKKIEVSLYYISGENNIFEKIITIDNDDLSAKEIEEQIKKELSKLRIKEPECFLTIKYMFLNNNEEIDILKTIQKGLNIMNNFIFELCETIGDNCKLCNKFKKLILEKSHEFTLKEFSFMTDCSYAVKENKFTFYDKANLYLSDKNNNLFSTSDIKKIPVKGNILFPKSESLLDLFNSFIITHSLIYDMQQKNILPTFVIIYDDMTFSLDSFFAFTKATIYRKVNDIAKMIKKENIVALMFVNAMVSYSENGDDLNNTLYDNRIKLADKEILTFIMVTSNAKEYQVCLDSDKTDDELYILQKIKNNTNNLIDFTFYPIRKAFIEKGLKKSNN